MSVLLLLNILFVFFINALIFLCVIVRGFTFVHILNHVVTSLLLSVMWCLEALPRLEAASRQNFHCLGLGLGLD